jgi:hypothetical protein
MSWSTAPDLRRTSPRRIGSLPPCSRATMDQRAGPNRGAPPLRRHRINPNGSGARPPFPPPKARFWHRWATTPLNERQVTLLDRLLDGFEGKLTSSKWAAIAKCSPDTALRDINELIALGALRKTAGGGRSTAYELDG